MKDSLKFFQSFIKTMVEVGGPNLPRTISTKLGTKLGKLYKNRRLAVDFEGALAQIYLVIKGSPIIKKIDDNNYEVSVKYPMEFCPIGGPPDPDPEKAKIFQESICLPYTIGFLTEIAPDYKISMELKDCLVEKSGRSCAYKLLLTKK